MTSERRDNFFILTGAPGSGKSTLLNHLGVLGLSVIAEPARQILAEQRHIDGYGLPDRDARLFVDLMLSRMIHEYIRREPPTVAAVFDRGIPDMLAYASHLGFDYPPGQNAARKYRYNRLVFFAPTWEQIYATDAERKMPFQAACQFGAELRAIYTGLGYDLIDIPCCSVEERAKYLLRFLQ